MDEALSLPTEEAVRIALRTQQILAHESGVAATADPLGGSWAVERLTRDIEEEARAYIAKIDDQGGAVAAIAFMQREIHEAAYRYQREVEERARIVVGVNDFVADEPPPGNLFQIDATLGEALGERVHRLRARRDRDRVARTLDALGEAARGSTNLMPVIVDAVEASATLERSVTACAVCSAPPARGDPVTRAALALAGFALVTMAMLSAAEAGLADRIGATFALMADEFVMAFEPLQGMIVAVEGAAVYLDLGEPSGVRVGQEFVVFRRGEAFHHQVTGKQLGHYESILGHAQVRRVQAEFSEAVFVSRARPTVPPGRGWRPDQPGPHQGRGDTGARPDGAGRRSAGCPTSSPASSSGASASRWWIPSR